MIEPVVYSYTPVTVGTAIPATLAAFNAGFAALEGKQVAVGAMFSSGLPRFYGGEVTAGAFPVLNVAAGKLLLGDGTVYSFPAGTLTAASPAAADVFSVYVSEDFELDIADTVPGTAILALAELTVNGGATAFVIDQGVLSTVITSFSDYGDPLTEELRSGPIVLETTTYTYTELGQVATSVAVSEAKTTTKTFIYDGDGVFVSANESVDPFGFFLPAGV